jgi:hypothetical protein
MSKLLIAGALAGVLVGAAAGASAQALNVRTGGWDLTVKMSFGGQLREHRFKTCVTKEDLDSARAFQKDDDDCTHKLTTRSATRWAGSVTCGGEHPSKGTFDITAISPESITMKSTREAAKQGSGSIEMTGRFASASCMGYED